MQCKVRLGYPFFIKVRRSRNKMVPAGWFWGERGEYQDYPHPWTDSTYQEAKRRGFKNVPKYRWGYMAEFNLDFFRSEKGRFEQGIYTVYIKEDKSFIVPIQIMGIGVRDLEYLDRVQFPKDLLQYIWDGKAKVLFFSHMEGMNSISSFQHIQNFCKNNSLNKEHVYVSVSNLIASDCLPEDPLFTVREFNYFGEELWFLQKSKINFTELERKKVLNRYRQGNGEGCFISTFLCLNRRPVWFRNYLGAFLQCVGNLPKISQVSLGSGNDYDKEQVTGRGRLNTIVDYSSERLKYFSEVKRWYEKQLDDIVSFSPDEQGVMFRNRVDFSEELYRSSFCTIVTETYFDIYNEEPWLFFSEKTFKPIYGLRPFILVAAPGSLQKLHELGYRTFGRWWNEDYDQIEDSVDRMNAICDLILDLSKKSKKELRSMLQDMESTLSWNWNRLMSTFDIEDTIQWLENLSGRDTQKKVVSLI